MKEPWTYIAIVLFVLAVTLMFTSCESVQFDKIAETIEDRTVIQTTPEGEEQPAVELVVTTEVFGFMGFQILGFPIIPGLAVVKNKIQEPTRNPPK